MKRLIQDDKSSIPCVVIVSPFSHKLVVQSMLQELLNLRPRLDLA